MSEATANFPNIPDAWEIPLEKINVLDPVLFENDAHWDFFERLRKEDPVHLNQDDEFGRYWSVTKFNDIMTVDTNHDIYSSDGGITIGPPASQVAAGQTMQTPMFIAMDPPKHDVQRATVSPVVQPSNLAKLEDTIRTRAAGILDSLPRGETFDWVDTVSIELTTQMLATLFDFPFEDRRMLTRWSDVATAPPGIGIVDTAEQRRDELLECLAYFTRLWNERAAMDNPGSDLISMLAHGEDTKNMAPYEFLGNLILLIVGGNDTTRNSISGGVLALNQNPEEYDKLRNNPELIPNMVAEIIRWQTPLPYMRRTANQDVELRGKKIRKGEQLLMWYISGNRDEEVFENADKLIIDRKNARQHVSFGFGLHRCMGNRLAEMQLRVLWEEFQKRFHKVEVTGAPKRTPSNFVKGYTKLMVKLTAKTS